MISARSHVLCGGTVPCSLGASRRANALAMRGEWLPFVPIAQDAGTDFLHTLPRRQWSTSVTRQMRFASQRPVVYIIAEAVANEVGDGVEDPGGCLQ
jgi:hypothetical protein